MTSLFVTGSHPLMQKIRSLASRLARCDTPILIQGEHGTGKHELARHIHQQSHRATAPFFSIDCAAASATHLVDIINKAHGGTIFFSNVGRLDTEIHSVVSETIDATESHTGGTRCAFADVRLIASAEPELETTARTFDLIERLSRIALFLPPLRERRSDIPILVRHLLDRYASSHDGPPCRFPDDTMVLLWQYDWPGNLRELAEVVHQSATDASDGIIHPRLLPSRLRTSPRYGAASGLRVGNCSEDRRFLSERKLFSLL